MIITRKSPVTGVTHSLDLPVTEQQIQAWQEGQLIQNVFPDLSPGDREFIKTGITNAEWNDMFGMPEESEDIE
jgi:hypothetical protein